MGKKEEVFEVGQRLKLCSDNHPFCNVHIGDYATYKGGEEFLFDGKQHSQWCSNREIWGRIFTKEATMSEYQAMKKRIEAVTGWDRKADDILQELYSKGGRSTRLWVEDYGNSGCVVLVSHGMTLSGIAREGLVGGTTWKAEFIFSNQCNKLEAFKKALLWLLNYSSIKKKAEEVMEKAKKMKALQQKLKEIQKEVTELQELC